MSLNRPNCFYFVVFIEILRGTYFFLFYHISIILLLESHITKVVHARETITMTSKSVLSTISHSKYFFDVAIFQLGILYILHAEININSDTSHRWAMFLVSTYIQLSHSIQSAAAAAAHSLTYPDERYIYIFFFSSTCTARG